VTDNEDVGILLSFSSSTTLCNNVIANTAQRGISLMSATGNLIIGNTFRGNRFGIYSDVSFGDSQIYHNDFLNNIANACDWEENIWDNGYPSGGNYWSNFDQTSEGAYDDDGDGIADSACSISCGDNQDRYPFMNPHHTPLIPGDANKDWLINTGDVIYLINYLFRDGPAPDPLAAGDCDGDGVVGTGDVVYLLNYLFRGGPPPTC
jgi:parallel beta-helix repeat protein